MTLRVYIPKAGDRVRVRLEALDRLGVPRAVGGSGATVFSLGGKLGLPIVRLDAEPWATPADAYGSGRDDGFELLPRDLWPSAEIGPSELEAELLDIFWAAAFALTPRSGRLDYEELRTTRPADLVAVLVELVEESAEEHCLEATRPQDDELDPDEEGVPPDDFEDGPFDSDGKVPVGGPQGAQDAAEAPATEEPAEELPDAGGSPRPSRDGGLGEAGRGADE